LRCLFLDAEVGTVGIAEASEQLDDPGGDGLLSRR
jgi:hypothetical protein